MIGSYKLHRKSCPITLVRLLIAKKPLSEKQIGTEIFKLLFSGILQ